MVIFADSAFRHGYQEADFYEVLESKPWKVRSRRGLRDVYEVYGCNHGGDYLHVAIRVEANVTTVFHIRRMTDREKRTYRSRQ